MSTRMIALMVALLVLFASQALPSPLPACGTDTLSDYLLLTDGCVLGNLVFSDFQYNNNVLSGRPNLVTADEVMVNPFMDAVSTGLSFQGEWHAGLGQVVDYLLYYNVSTLDGLAEITTDYLGWQAERTGPISVASLDDFLCPGSKIGEPACGNPPQPIRIYQRLTPAPSSPSDRADFPAVATIGVLKDIFVDGQLGTATITEARNSYNTPEPSSLCLGAAGALILVLRRLNNASV